MGLADTIDSTDFSKKLSELKSIWEKLCPGFSHWFLKKRSQLFQDSVTASARNGSNIYGLFYNNNVESNHFREKNEQAFKKKSVLGVLDTLKTLLMRQQEDEIKALYESGPYRLSAPYKKFQKDSVVFHNMNTENRRKLVNQINSLNQLEVEENQTRQSVKENQLLKFLMIAYQWEKTLRYTILTLKNQPFMSSILDQKSHVE